jgi:hypothetical protein
LDQADADAVAKVREAHDAERRIAQLSELPANKERLKLIEELRKKTPNQPLQRNASTKSVSSL